MFREEELGVLLVSEEDFERFFTSTAIYGKATKAFTELEEQNVELSSIKSSSLNIYILFFSY